MTEQKSYQICKCEQVNFHSNGNITHIDAGTTKRGAEKLLRELNKANNSKGASATKQVRKTISIFGQKEK